MTPNSQNQPGASSSVGGIDIPTAPYPQEQPPMVKKTVITKDPSSGDKAADPAKQTKQTKTTKTTTQASKKNQTKQDQKKSSQNQGTAQQTAQQAAGQESYLPPGYPESAVLPGMPKPQPEELLFEWQSKSRPFKKHNRQFFTSIGVIGLLMALILIFAGQWLPMAVVVAVVFVIYVFNTIPPGTVIQQATNYGIRVEEKLYYWEEMGLFWFTEKYGETLLNIEIDRFPNRLSILIGDLNQDDLTAFLSEILLNQQPPPTTYEKMAAWVQRKLPLDLDN